MPVKISNNVEAGIKIDVVSGVKVVTCSNDKVAEVEVAGITLTMREIVNEAAVVVVVAGEERTVVEATTEVNQTTNGPHAGTIFPLSLRTGRYLCLPMNVLSCEFTTSTPHSPIWLFSLSL